MVFIRVGTLERSASRGPGADGRGEPCKCLKTWQAARAAPGALDRRGSSVKIHGGRSAGNWARSIGIRYGGAMNRTVLTLATASIVALGCGRAALDQEAATPALAVMES